MRGKRAVIPMVLSLLFAGYFLGQERLEEPKHAAEYRIGPQDLLNINVFGIEELNTTVRVSEDGKITLPLLGEIEVEGLTKAEIEKKLNQLLQEKYLQNPQVTIFIKEYQSKGVSILGAVEEPGYYDLLGNQTLLHIIARAKGFTGDVGDEIIVIRKLQDSTSNTLKISMDDLILEGDSRLNIPLEPDDIIIIPVIKTVVIYVFGQVNKPGALQVKKSDIPTLVQAIAQAGGFSDRASKGRVLIKRTDKNGKEQQIRVNVKKIIGGKKKDIQLMENDVVYVPETIF